MAIPVVTWAQAMAMVAGIGIAPDIPVDFDLADMRSVPAAATTVHAAEGEEAPPSFSPEVLGAAAAQGEEGQGREASCAARKVAQRATVEATGAITREHLVETLRGILFTGHMEVVAGLPADYGWFVYKAAREEGVDPKDLAAVLISENSGPAMDFSFEGAAGRSYALDWEPEAEGRAGERGLFQVSPFWARKAGVDEEALYEAETNVRVAAFVVRTNQERHAECESRRYLYHTWIAHYKCAPDERDEIEGFCRFKQKKWHKLRASLNAFQSPDFAAIGRAHDKAVEKVQRRAARDWRRTQRKARERERRRRQLEEAASQGAQ